MIPLIPRPHAAEHARLVAKNPALAERYFAAHQAALLAEVAPLEPGEERPAVCKTPQSRVIPPIETKRRAS